jgi:hypothetical protein
MNRISTEANKSPDNTSVAGLWSNGISSLTIVGPWVTFAVIVTWVLTFFRLTPTPYGDYGIAVSVAERLIAGDSLYSQVWDNRDPLYYWTLALFRLPGPLGGNALEFLWFAVAATATFFIARALGARLRTRVVIAGIAVPIVLAGTTYVPGSTHLGATAISLVAIGLILHSHYFWTGALIPAVFFSKILVFPIAVALILTLFLAAPRWSRFLALILGSTVAATAIVGILTFRSELIPYFNSLKLNVTYSQTSQSGEVQGSYFSNLEAVINLNTQVTIGSIIIGILVSMMLFKALTGHQANSVIAFTLAGIVVSLGAAIVVVALTGKWWHHGQVFLLPAVISLALLITLSQRISVRSGYVTPLFVAVAALFFAGVPSAGTYIQALEYARSNISAQSRMAPMTIEMLKLGSPTTYARIGQGSDSGHAFGLREWKLNCRRFHQLPWESERILGETLDCASGTAFLAVDTSAVEIDGLPVWNDFIQSFEKLIDMEYQCQVFTFGRLCERII